MATEATNLKSGQTCPKCGEGRLYVVQTKRNDVTLRTPYLGCNAGCGFKGKQVVLVNEQGKGVEAK